MSEDGNPKPKLPKEQLAILAIARFAEPIAYTSVFPYLPEMIRDFGVSQNEVAKWAGMTSAAFSIAQSTTAVPWGRASDRWGRKPTLLLGLISTMVMFLIWGMSTSLTMAVTVRAIQGAGNGNVGIIRTMVAEMVTEKELQPVAFSIMPLVWSLGSVVGPSFGGFFAQPARQFPNIFGNSELLKKYPYLLPNLIATVFFLISLASAALFLQETLASRKHRKDWGLLVGQRLTRALPRRKPVISHRRTSFVDGEATAPLVPSKALPKGGSKKQPPATSMSEVFTRQTSINLICYTFLAFHSVAYDQNITVLLNYPVKEHTPENTKFPFYFTGGFGLESGKIGTIFAIYGIACGLIQFLVYPPLVAKFGVLRCYRACTLLMPFVYAITPYAALLPTERTRLAAILIVLLFKAFGIIISFPSMTILLTNSCSSLRVLGTLNGFATMFSGIGRAVGPASAGLAFSWGAEKGYIGTSNFFLATIAAIGIFPVFMIVEGDGPSADKDASESGDTEDSEAVTNSSGSSSLAIDEDDEETDVSQGTATTPLLSKKQATDYFSINKSRD